MANNLNSLLTNVANAIRSKKGTSALINAQDFANEIESIQTGGSTYTDYGLFYKGKNRVRYLDIDGKVLKIEYLENGSKLTPPDIPNYDPDYLVFDCWNYDIDNYVVERPTDVGAIYNTIDDYSYFWVDVMQRLGFSYNLTFNNFESIDWGDGTVDSEKTHTYASEGSYLIKIKGNFSVSNSFGVYTFGSSNINKSIKKAYVKSGCTLGGYAFSYCSSLEIVSLPSSITSLGSNSFYGCNLKCAIIPNNI